MLPRTLPKFNGDLEDVTNRVLNNIGDIEDHDECKKNVGSDECFTTIDNEDDEGGKSEDE